MTRPLFTVVIPTIGRPTLMLTLASIDTRLAEVIVVADTHGGLPAEALDVLHATVRPPFHLLTLDAGQHDIGSPQLHMGFHRAAGHFILNFGDDDVYEPGAFDLLAEAVDPNAPAPLMFRTVLHPNAARGNRHPVTLWEEQSIERFKVTGQSFVCPNDRRLMGRWVDDVTFMRETVALHGGRVEWRDELIARCY